MEDSTMCVLMDLPSEGHLSAVFQTLSFLKSNHNCVTVFDPSNPEIGINHFLTEDWSETPYGPCKEDVPSNSSTPRGAGFSIRDFSFSDHDGDSVDRPSKTGFMFSPRKYSYLYLF